MKNYIVYDPTSGEILRSGACQDSVFEIVAQDGESAIEGMGTSATHYIDSNGSLARYEDSVATTKSSWPTYTAEWCNESFTWRDMRSTDAVLADQWTAVRAHRDQLLANTDWLSLRAREQGVELDAVWVEYRQALRDITNQTDPAAIVWPGPVEP